MIFSVRFKKTALQSVVVVLFYSFVFNINICAQGKKKAMIDYSRRVCRLFGLQSIYLTTSPHNAYVMYCT